MGGVMCVHMHEAHPLLVLHSKRPGVLHMCTLAGAIEKPSHNNNNSLSIQNNICIQAYYILPYSGKFSEGEIFRNFGKNQ